MTNRAVCIGINDYPGTNSDLAGCVNDALDWANMLRSRGFDARTLLDAAATKINMVDAMRKIVAETRYGETGIVQYSGHGTWIPDEDDDESDRRDEALCPYDIFDAQLVTDDEIDQIFRARKFGARLILISDSCHSGSVQRLVGPIGDASAKVRFLAPEVFLRGRTLERAERVGRAISGKARAHHVLLLSGCQDWEYSYDASFDGRANGAFTYVAIRALAELDPDANYQWWMDRIRQRLPSQNYPQTPGLSGARHMKRQHVFD